MLGRARRAGGSAREALDEQGHRTIGWRIRVPIAFGLHEFDTSDLGAAVSLDNVSTLTAVPGVEFDIPMTDRWSCDRSRISAGAGRSVAARRPGSIGPG